MTVRNSDGTEEIPTPEQLRKKHALTRNQVMRLTQLGKKIEKYYEMPMDVEWALEKDKFILFRLAPLLSYRRNGRYQKRMLYIQEAV